MRVKLKSVGDAKWGAKGNKIAVGNDGKKHKETQYYYGYKDQVSLNAGNGLVTSVIPGRADDYDGHKFRKLVDKDLSKGIEVGIVAADKGYDDGENHYYLEQRGINSAIRLNNNRTRKKDGNKEGWIKLKESSEYQEGLKERYKVERKFGEAKKWHGFARCRYVGFMRHAIQSYLTFIALNLKRMVKLLTGVSFRGELRAYPLGS
jgi:IS5 family transposase